MVYDTNKYSERRPNVGVTIVPFIFEDKELKVLVYKRADDAEVFPSQYALPNCFFDISEMANLDAAAENALAAKTSVEFPYLDQIYTFSGNYIDPDRIITLNIAYLALAQKDQIKELSDNKFETKWMSLSVLFNKELAFNHNEVLKMALQRLNAKAEYTNISTYLLNKNFTITELREVTEYLIDVKLDNSRFRDRIKKTDIITEVDGQFKKGVQRPAQLYSRNDNFRGCFYPKSLTKPI
jgi:8-oxo-dGTP diphosphatase